MARGQSMMIDYMAGAFIFLVLFSFFFVLWDMYTTRYTDALVRMQLDSAVLSISESLVNSPGEPLNWTSNAANAKRIGLSRKQNSLDWERINALSSLSYAEQKIKLGVDSDFVVRIDNMDGARIATIGNEPNSTVTSVEITRFAMLDNAPVKFRLMIYET